MRLYPLQSTRHPLVLRPLLDHLHPPPPSGQGDRGSSALPLNQHTIRPALCRCCPNVSHVGGWQRVVRTIFDNQHRSGNNRRASHRICGGILEGPLREPGIAPGFAGAFFPKFEARRPLWVEVVSATISSGIPWRRSLIEVIRVRRFRSGWARAGPEH